MRLFNLHTLSIFTKFFIYFENVYIFKLQGFSMPERAENEITFGKLIEMIKKAAGCESQTQEENGNREPETHKEKQTQITEEDKKEELRGKIKTTQRERERVEEILQKRREERKATENILEKLTKEGDHVKFQQVTAGMVGVALIGMALFGRS